MFTVDSLQKTTMMHIIHTALAIAITSHKKQHNSNVFAVAPQIQTRTKSTDAASLQGIDWQRVAQNNIRKVHNATISVPIMSR